MVPLQKIVKNYDIPRDIIINDAINRKVTLYFPINGGFEKVFPTNLFNLPNPETQYDKKETNDDITPASTFIWDTLQLQPTINQKIRLSRSLYIKKDDLDDYISLKNKAQSKKNNFGSKKKLNKLERLVGALIVANYQECRTKAGKYKSQPIQDKLSEQISIMDFNLDLIGKNLDETTIKSAILAFHKQQYSESGIRLDPELSGKDLDKCIENIISNDFKNK